MLNAAQHRLFKYAEGESEKATGLSVTQSAALLFIAKNEGCLQKALADATGLNQSAVTGLVARMLKNKLLERKPCPDDGRAARLYLSDKGRAVVPQIQLLVKRLNRQLTAEFTSSEIDTVTRFLNTIVNNYH